MVRIDLMTFGEAVLRDKEQKMPTNTGLQGDHEVKIPDFREGLEDVDRERIRCKI